MCRLRPSAGPVAPLPSITVYTGGDTVTGHLLPKAKGDDPPSQGSGAGGGTAARQLCSGGCKHEAWLQRGHLHDFLQARRFLSGLWRHTRFSNHAIGSEGSPLRRELDRHGGFRGGRQLFLSIQRARLSRRCRFGEIKQRRGAESDGVEAATAAWRRDASDCRLSAGRRQFLGFRAKLVSRFLHQPPLGAEAERDSQHLADPHLSHSLQGHAGRG